MTTTAPAVQYHDLLTPTPDAHEALRSIRRTFPGRVVCATGHRPQDLPGYADRDFPVLVSIAEDALRAARPAVVITGGAIGWDQAVAQATLNLHVPLVLALPFPTQHTRWVRRDQQRALDHVRDASLAYVVAHPNTESRQEVVRALLGRNVEMLRWADGVLPLHSGKTSGGTAACLQEARRRGVHVLPNAFPAWEAYQRGERPVVHRVTRTPLSNFSPAPITVSGVTYPTVEHAYQACKTVQAHERERILAARTPAEAKRLGQTVTLREDWPERRLSIMTALLRQKFRAGDARVALQATGRALIIEGVTWGDTFWGVQDGYGCNHLGRLLMAERDR